MGLLVTVDPLADVAAEEEARRCKHPHVKFENWGNAVRCVDCKRYWLAGWKDPKGMETMMTDFTYRNPEMGPDEFRHSPNETPRREGKIR